MLLLLVTGDQQLPRIYQRGHACRDTPSQALPGIGQTFIDYACSNQSGERTKLVDRTHGIH